MHMGGSNNTGEGIANQPRRRCQGNPCSTGIRWGVPPTAQLGCQHGKTGSPPGAY